MATIEREVLTEELLSEEWCDDQAYIDDAGMRGAGQRRFDAMRAALAELPEGFRIERGRAAEIERVPAGAGSPQIEAYRVLTGLATSVRVDVRCTFTVIDERRHPPRPVANVVRRRQIGRQGITCSPFAHVDPQVALAIASALALAAADAEGRPA